MTDVVRVEPKPGPGDWVLVGLLTALMGVVAVFGIFFLPTYAGSIPIPAVIVPVAAALVWIPRAGYRLTGRMVAAFAPTGLWLIVTIGLYLTTNGLYRSVPVVWTGWQFAALIGLGGLAAAGSIGLLWGDHLRAELQARPTTPSPGAGPAR